MAYEVLPNFNSPMVIFALVSIWRVALWLSPPGPGGGGPTGGGGGGVHQAGEERVCQAGEERVCQGVEEKIHQRVGEGGRRTVDGHSLGRRRVEGHHQGRRRWSWWNRVESSSWEATDNHLYKMYCQCWSAWHTCIYILGSHWLTAACTW